MNRIAGRSNDLNDWLPNHSNSIFEVNNMPLKICRQRRHIPSSWDKIDLKVLLPVWCNLEIATNNEKATTQVTPESMGHGWHIFFCLICKLLTSKQDQGQKYYGKLK